MQGHPSSLCPLLLLLSKSSYNIYSQYWSLSIISGARPLLIPLSTLSSWLWAYHLHLHHLLRPFQVEQMIMILNKLSWQPSNAPTTPPRCLSCLWPILLNQDKFKVIILNLNFWSSPRRCDSRNLNLSPFCSLSSKSTLLKWQPTVIVVFIIITNTWPSSYWSSTNTLGFHALNIIAALVQESSYSAQPYPDILIQQWQVKSTYGGISTPYTANLPGPLRRWISY